MLSDYHMHLVPDGAAARAVAESAWAADGGFLATAWIERYVDRARSRAVSEIAITEHVHRFSEARDWHPNPFWRDEATEDVDEYCAAIGEAKAAELPVLLGIEMDWLADRQEQIARFLDGRPFDIVLGSVHWLGDAAVDHPDYPAWRSMPSEEVWSAYLRELGRAARSGLFDVLAHPDLPKVAGHQLPRKLDSLVGETIQVIAESGVAIECSSAGLRKRPRETYPAPELLARFRDAGVPATLASDAHAPEDVARDYPTTVAVLRGAGYETITRFRGRAGEQVPIGPQGRA